MSRFYCIDDGVPTETISALRAGCEAAQVEFAYINAGEADYAAEQAVEDYALLYRPATSHRAQILEQLMVHDRVATVYSSPDGAFRTWNEQSLLYARIGLPLPRSVLHVERDHAALERAVHQVGGFPVVLKVPGFSLGRGVMRVDSWPSLRSVLDYIPRSNPLVMQAYVAPAVHWRLVVVGNQVVSSYRNQQRTDDFRTFVADDIDDFEAPAPSAALPLAVAAVHVQGLEFGGVDVLEHESGRLYLLEANCPCYFAHEQGNTGTAVAKALVSHLKAKAARLRG